MTKGNGGVVVPIPTCRAAAVRASINVRAAYLDVDDEIRRKWVNDAINKLGKGVSAGRAISEAIHDMTKEHRAKGNEGGTNADPA